MVTDRSKFNQLLVLSRISDKNASRGTIASELGMTKQGLLYHIRSLKESGFLDSSEHITPGGYEYLYAGLMDLSKLIQSNLTIMHRNISWEAIADEDLQKGDRVFLYMQEGNLHASRTIESGSSGICITGAEKDQPIGIEKVEGIIRIKTGRIFIFTLPNLNDPEYSLEKLKLSISLKKEDGEKVGVIGEEAFSIVSSFAIPDFQFATINAAFDAALRGLSCSVYVSRSRFMFVSAELSELSKKFPQVIISVNSI